MRHQRYPTSTKLTIIILLAWGVSILAHPLPAQATPATRAAAATTALAQATVSTQGPKALIEWDMTTPDSGVALQSLPLVPYQGYELPMTLLADTLYLRNGQRIQGELVSVRGNTIEFQERRGFGGSRTVRVDRNDVDRIDFDGYGSGGSGGGWGGGSGSGWALRIPIGLNPRWLRSS